MSYAETKKRLEKLAISAQGGKIAVRDRRGKTHVEDVVQFEVAMPKGHVEVELRDERDKVVEHQEGDNFISRIWAICSRSWQHFAFGPVMINSGAALVGNGAVDMGWTMPGGRSPMFYPQEWVACWNDASAEAPLTEHQVVCDGQGIVAFANRRGGGLSPTQARGNPNSTESILRTDGEVMVYDWPTSAGNGTFQSIGYTMLRGGTSHRNGKLLQRPSLIDRRYVIMNDSYTGSVVGQNGIYPGIYAPGVGGIDASGNWVDLAKQSGVTTGGFKLSTMPASDWYYPAVPDSWGGSTTAPIAPTVNPNNGLLPSGGTLTTTVPSFLGESGGFYWLGYVNPNTAPDEWRICRVNKTTLACDNSLVFATGDMVLQGYPAGCMIGTNIFITRPRTDGSSTIYRIQTAAMPPTVTATITITKPSTWDNGIISAMCSDGTDLYLHDDAMGLYKVNTSGTILNYYGIIPLTVAVDTEDFTIPVSQTVVYTAGNPMMATLAGGTIGGSTAGLDRVYGQSATQLGGPGAIKFAGGTFALLSPALRAYRASIPTPTSSTPGTVSGQSSHLSLFWWDSKLWAGYNFNSNTEGDSNQTCGRCYFEVGWNLGSRVLLPSPVTKNNTQTMKIRYDITLPDIVQ